jgi:acetyl-CoA dehydrogenase-like protein
MYLGATAFSGKLMDAFAFAHPLMEVSGDVMFAWMHLWRALAAAPQLEKLVGSLDPEARNEKAAKNKNAAFYEGQLKTAEFYIMNTLPVTLGKMETILKTNGAVVEMLDASFGG